MRAGSAPEANSIPVPKQDAELYMDAAACIGCGACVANCKNASAMLFVAAKVSQFAYLPQGRVERGKRVRGMVAQADKEQIHVHLGIAHTRWATHGVPSERNAHPHLSGGLAVVHNDIIENHEGIRARLSALGYQFQSDTDTEVIAHLIAEHRKAGLDLLAPTCKAISELSMMSRDVRRANYNANALYCFANSECGDEANASAVQAADILITSSNGNTCFVFGLDRDWDGNADNDGGGAFRRVTEDSVRRIEMWVGSTAPNCPADNGDWIVITDPDLVDITSFNIENSEDTGSYSEELLEDEGVTLIQRVRFGRIEIEGQLNLDNTISRSIQDTIKVRNDFYDNVGP